MPPAKRHKRGAATRSQAASASASASAPARARPLAGDSEGDGEFASLAKQHWLKRSRRTVKVTVKNDVLKRDIWDAIEKEGFPFKSLHALEGLQTLERSVSCQFNLLPC